MAHVLLPEPGRPYALIEPAEDRDLAGLDVARIAALYAHAGALLFRGFDLDVGRFRRFARSFCPTSVINESPGRGLLDADHAIFSVDGGTGAFNLHPELSREPWKPDAAFFGCLSAPRHGGATTICDGVALAAALPEPVRRGLAGRRLLYIAPTWPELLAFWLGTLDPSDTDLANPPPHCPYLFRRIGAEVLRVFTRPALHRPMFVDAPAFGSFLLFGRFNNGRGDYPLLDDGHPVPEAWLQAIKAAGDRLQVPIPWQPGDVLMLDNTRFLHGRTAITDPGARLIATFFGYVGFARPDPEEVPDAPWRKADFAPPLPPDHPLRGQR